LWAHNAQYATLADRAAAVTNRTPLQIADRNRLAILLRRARQQSDPGVAQLVRDLEGAGIRVHNVNMGISRTAAHRLGEADIVLENAILQVKRTSSAGVLIKQIQETQLVTTRPVIGFVLARNRAGQRTVDGARYNGHLATNDFNELLDWVR